MFKKYPLVHCYTLFGCFFLISFVLPVARLRAVVAQCSFITRKMERVTTVSEVAPFDKVNLQDKRNCWLEKEMKGVGNCMVTAAYRDKGEKSTTLTLAYYKREQYQERTCVLNANTPLVVQNIANSRILPGDILYLGQELSSRGYPKGSAISSGLFCTQLTIRTIIGFNFPQDITKSMFYKNPYYPPGPDPLSLQYFFKKRLLTIEHQQRNFLGGVTDLAEINNVLPSFWASPAPNYCSSKGKFNKEEISLENQQLIKQQRALEKSINELRKSNKKEFEQLEQLKQNLLGLQLEKKKRTYAR